jgi:hypothetical protein
MNKLLILCLIIANIFGFMAYYYKNIAEEQEKLKDVYRGNNELLIGKMKKVYDDKMATDLRIKELEQEALKDKGVFDWNIDISNTNVIKGLKK